MFSFHPLRTRYSCRAFTLVEVVVGIAIIGIVTVGSISLGQNLQVRGKTELRDRLVYAIKNLIENQKDSAFLGRSIKIAGQFTIPDSIGVAATQTGFTAKYYLNHVQIGTGQTYTSPFLGSSQYSVSQVMVVQKNGTTTATDSAFIILFDNQGNITFSDNNNAVIAASVLFKCTVAYEGYKSVVVLDRRTGMVDIQ